MPRIISPATCALALIALAAPFAASGQGVGPSSWPQSQPIIGDGFYPQGGQIASGGGQLFTFGTLSNKGANCVAGSLKNHGRPAVVATFPAEGEVVRPGLVVVRVTFDQPMSCDASFEGQSDLPNPCPGRWREATLSQDRRSFRTVCEVAPGTRYRLMLHSFHNSHGLAIPDAVTFSTSAAPPIATVREALAEDAGYAAG